MKLSRYYVGENVPLAFTVWEGSTPKTPSAATVIITKYGGGATTSVSATIDTNTVSYNAPTSVTSIAGLYQAVFTLTIDGNTRKYKMKFEIMD